MISKKLSKRLAEQVGHELTASHHYLAMAVYFGLENLDKWAEIFKAQSAEERGHAMKIVDFLVDVGADFNIPSIAECKSKFGSALEAVKSALASEQSVTKSFNEMAADAIDEKDFTSFQFLQWFIEEQVEEEATMEKYVTLLQKESNPHRAEMIVAELEEHGE